MKPRASYFGRLILPAAAIISFCGPLPALLAADITKVDNSDNLSLGTSWALGTTPGASDIALWNNTVTGANSTLLGANATWLGIRITNPGGTVTIGAGNTLTLGTGGIDMSGASQGLSIATLASLNDTAQSWNVGNQALNMASFTRATGSTVNLITSGGGSVNIASGTASAALGGYAVLNSSDYAALDASKNVVAATYVNYAAGGNLSNTFSGILNITGTTTGATQAWRQSNPLTVASGVRFGQNNTQNTKWTVDTSSGGRVLTTPAILVGSAVTQNIEFNGSGGVRAGANAGELFIQNFGTGSLIFNTTINNPTSGSHTLTKAGSGKVVIASSSGYNGVTRINEGTFQLGNGGAVGSVGSASIINSGNLAFNRTDIFSAGYAISGSGSVTQSGSGTVSLTGSNTYTGATNFNEGTVSFNPLSNFGNGTVLSFNGGALSWNAVTPDISTRTVSIAAGGATLNTNGNNVTLANTIGNSGAGGLTKTGAGTLTLNGANYAGTTTVTGGTLVANGSIAGGAAVNIGATLGGTGTISGMITVGTDGIIAPGNGVGTITTGGLTLGSGSILNFEFNNTPASDYINVTHSGGLTINGGGFNLYAEGTVNAFSNVGSYNLIGYSGVIGGTGTGSLAVLNPQAGKVYGFGVTESNVTLDITAAGVISDWDVDADGSWNTSGNWTSTVPNRVGETANFSKTLTAVRMVTLDGAKTVGGLSFNGGVSPLGYTIAQGTSGALALDNGINQVSVIVTSGSNIIGSDVSIDSAVAVASVNTGAFLTISGSISGVGGLMKSGAGTLDLTNVANGYDGSTTLAGGTLGFSALGSLGDGHLSIDGGTLHYHAGNTADISAKIVTLMSNGGTINTNGNDVTLANAIGNSGVGSLTKTGSGTLTLGGSNTYTGDTIVNSGTLAISANDNLGSSATGASLTLNGATLNNTSSVSLDNAGANARSVTVGASGATFKTDATLTVLGQVNGSSSLTKTGSGILQLNGNNSSTLAGSITLAQGVVALGGGLANGMNGIGTAAIVFQGGTLNLNGYGEADNGTSYGTLGNAISVATGQTGTLNLPKRLTVGSTLTGAGTLDIVLDGTRNEFQGNWSAFTGQINLAGPGEFRIANFQASVFNNAKLNLGSGVLLQQVFNPPSSGNLTTVQNIGELSGAAGSIIGGSPVGGRYVEWSVGSLNTNSTFSGTIRNDTDATNGFGESKLTKVGTGTLALESASTYTGATTINGGTLVINGDHSAATGLLTVASSATNATAVRLKGSGTVGGNTSLAADPDAGGAQVGGIHSPGNSVGRQTFDATGAATTNLTYNSGSIFEWELGATPAATDIIKDGGDPDLVTGSNRGVAYDAVNVSGTLGGSGAIFRVVLDGIQNFSESFWTEQREWTDIFRAADHINGEVETASLDVASIFTGGFQYYNYSGIGSTLAELSTPSAYGSFSITGSTLTWSAVPEPTSALAGLLIGAGLLRRRRA